MHIDETDDTNLDESNIEQVSDDSTKPEDMEKIETAVLGETPTKFTCDRIAEVNEAACHLFSQAKRTLCLFTRDLDPRVLSERHIEHAVTNLAKSSRYSEVRILIFDVQSVQSANHRLISVAQSLSSYVKIKVVSKDFHDLPYSFYLADDCGIMYRPIHSDFNCEFHFNNKRMVADKQKLFNDIWEHSRIASEFRALGL